MKRHIIFNAVIAILALLISGCGMLQEAEPPLTGGGESGLTVYFIDVGQADSALIVCDGAAMLIDGGNASDSSLIYAFLENHGVTHLDYIVATHAHEDHIGGLAGALNYAGAGVALCPVTEYDSRAFGSFVKYLGEQGVSITVPAHGDTFRLGGADVMVIGPVSPAADTNNSSIVLKLTYGAISFLFTGDAERASEQAILDAGYDISADVLKAGHHGSDTSTTYPFLREIMPDIAVISCGRNNSYGHPDEALLSRLRDADVTLYRTDMQGTVVITSDGVTLDVAVERNADAETNPTKPAVEVEEEYYIGNKNTKRYHRPSCSGLPAEQNRVIFETRIDADSEGYSPCGTCKP